MKLLTPFMCAGLVFTLGACKPSTSGQSHSTSTPESTSQEARLDEREILPLNQLQRQHVLEEMRGLLIATQGVVEGLAKNDMAMVQEAAAAAGMNAMHTVENQKNMKRLKMRKSVPPEFMTLGQGVHKAFDEIAQMATDGKHAKDIQLKLVDTMNACAACHSAYQIPNP